MPRIELRNPLAWILGALLAAFACSTSAPASAPPQPPTELSARDKPWDGGGVIFLEWTASTTPLDQLQGYEVLARELGVTAAELADQTERAADAAAERETESLLEGEGIAPEDADQQARLEVRADPVAVPVEQPE